MPSFTVKVAAKVQSIKKVTKNVLVKLHLRKGMSDKVSPLFARSPFVLTQLLTALPLSLPHLSRPSPRLSLQ